MTTPSAHIAVFPQHLDQIGQQVRSTHTTMVAAASAADRLDLSEATAGPTLARLGYLASYANFQHAFAGALRGNADSVAGAGQHMVGAAGDFEQADYNGASRIHAAARPEPV